MYIHPNRNPPDESLIGILIFPTAFSMARHVGYRGDADCGCSLTACENGLIVSSKPWAHLQALLEPEVRANIQR